MLYLKARSEHVTGQQKITSTEIRHQVLTSQKEQKPKIQQISSIISRTVAEQKDIKYACDGKIIYIKQANGHITALMCN